MAEIKETIVDVEQAKDIYDIEPDLCNSLIEKYNLIARRTFKLTEAWTKFTSVRY